MQRKTTKISVLMSVYNGDSYLEESIESILNQTFKDFEFIIINDRSNDRSAEIIAKYAAKDRRIIAIANESNIGLTKSLNKGLKIATGKYIARQDADDISLPTRLEKELAVLENCSEIGVVSSNIEFIDSQGNSLEICKRDCEPSLVRWYLLFYNRLAGHSQVMYRRQLILELGGYDETRRYSQDYELWSRAIDICQIVILPEILLKQRRHDGSISASKSIEQQEYSLAQSQQNIERASGRKISLELVKSLRGFWLGHWWSHRFPNTNYLKELNSILLEVYLAFKQKISGQESDRSTIAKNIFLSIAKQYMCWIQAPLNQNRGAIAKIKISYYAAFWNPLLIPIAWLKLFYQTAIIIFKKAYKTNIFLNNKLANRK